MEITTLPIGLDDQPPSLITRRAAVVITGLSIACALALAPFAKIRLGALPAFAPVNQAALVINDLITVVLLLGHWRLTRRRTIMVLACAYLFSAVMAAVHALSRVASEVAGTTPADGPRAAAVRRAAPQSRGASAFDSKYRIM